MKPIFCPFCGSEEIKAYPPKAEKLDILSDKIKFSVVSCECGATMRGPYFDFSCRKAIEKWNARAY
jgi:hypothetical protein